MALLAGFYPLNKVQWYQHVCWNGFRSKWSRCLSYLFMVKISLLGVCFKSVGLCLLSSFPSMVCLLSSQKRSHLGASLAVQWLRLRTSSTGDLGSIPGQGTKHVTSHMSHSMAKRETESYTSSGSPAHVWPSLTSYRSCHVDHSLIFGKDPDWVKRSRALQQTDPGLNDHIAWRFGAWVSATGRCKFRSHLCDPDGLHDLSSWGLMRSLCGVLTQPSSQHPEHAK